MLVTADACRLATIATIISEGWLIEKLVALSVSRRCGLAEKARGIVLANTSLRVAVTGVVPAGIGCTVAFHAQEPHRN